MIPTQCSKCALLGSLDMFPETGACFAKGNFVQEEGRWMADGTGHSRTGHASWKQRPAEKNPHNKCSDYKPAPVICH